MSSDYDAVVAALPRLTPDERGRVLARLKMLESLAPEKSLAAATGAFADGFAGELLDAVAAVVLGASGERAAPAMLRRLAIYRAFAIKAEGLGKFFMQHAPDRVRRRALARIAVELLHRELAEAGYSVTSRLLMQCIHQLPAALDRAFPGYARAGALGMVVGRTAASEERSDVRT